MKLKLSLLILKFVAVMKLSKTQNMSGFIVGGGYSRIQDFPHSVFLHIYCNGIQSACGASILNQALLLSAAHCFATRCRRDFEIRAFAGTVYKFKGQERTVAGIKVHERYDEVEVANDIALLSLVRNFEFGRNVRRVAIIKTPTKPRTAVIAGWGAVDRIGTGTNSLKHTIQKILSNETCHRIVQRVPRGAFCGQESSYPERGDSGNALIVNYFIQIGILSFKIRAYSNETLVYTDVSYFYNWIKLNARNLYCSNKKMFKKVKDGRNTKKSKRTRERKLIRPTRFLRCPFKDVLLSF